MDDDSSDAMPTTTAVVLVSPEETHGLRRQVLRDGDPMADVDVAEDHIDGAFHLGARDRSSGHLVGVASFSPRESPWRPGARAFQLRWMAVDGDFRSAGVGGALLEHGFDRLRAVGATVIWANARDTALRFYERCGMDAVDDGFVNDAGIPHHVVVRDL